MEFQAVVALLSVWLSQEAKIVEYAKVFGGGFKVVK